MRRFLPTLLLAALLLAGIGRPVPEAAAQGAPADAAAADEADAFGARVRAYLLENPEVILEALRVLEGRQKAAQAEAIRRTIAERRAEIFEHPASPVGGNPRGDVTLVEFFDYNCPYCRRVVPAVRAVLRDDPGLRFVYKEFPILGAGSEFAAKAALAAARQGKYEAFHDALMRASGKVAEDGVLAIAAEVGLDLERLERDMDDPAIAEEIARNRALAAALGIDGTPGFVIGDRVVPGAVDQGTLRTLVRAARQPRAEKGGS